MPKIVATKRDWVELGFDLFSKNGDAGLNVDKMSRMLNCNKSSFYWHFKTKRDFVDSLIEHWIEIDTIQIMSKVNKHNSPRDKLLELIRIAFKKDTNLDFIFHLKKYSQEHTKIQEIVEHIDQERITFVVDLLIGMGYSKKDAALKASIFYKYLIGYHEMIRYKRQNQNYLSEVHMEIEQFITLSSSNEK